MAIERDEFLRRQRALADFGEFALRCDDLQPILQQGCELIAAALGTDLAKVMEIDRDSDTALVRAGIGWGPDVVGKARISLSERSSEAFAIEHGEPVVTADIASEDRFEFPSFMREQGVVAIVNVPIFLPGGRPYGLLQVDACEPRDFGEDDIQFLRTYCSVVGPVIDRLYKIDEIDRGNERLRLIVENARDYAIVLSDADDIVTDWFPGAEAIFGWSEQEMVGQPAALIYTPEDQAAHVPQRETGRATMDGATPNIRWHATKSGGRVFMDGQTVALRNPDGSVSGFLKIGQNVTERKRNEERQAVLLAELQHRVRNVLAMVGSVVNRGDVSGTVQEFRARLSGRIAAMARTQALLTRTAGAGVDLEGMVRDELLAQMVDEHRVTVEGPTITLAPKAAEVLTLAVHELAVNATKYGTFAQEAGHLDARWRVETRAGQDWLEFDWRESGIEMTPEPNRRLGFGTELITRRVPYEIRGEGEIAIGADGLRCRIAFPLTPGESVLQTDIPADDVTGQGVLHD